MANKRGFHKFFLTLLELQKLNEVRNDIKCNIGDSIFNNRVLTVNQIIRHLLDTRQTKTALKVQAVYDYMRSKVWYHMRETRALSRSDAYDINEFVNSYRDIVMDGRSSHDRQQISRLVNNVR